MSPSTTTIVSAPMTMMPGSSPNRSATVAAFARARRSACGAGASPGTTVSSSSAGLTACAIPMSDRSSRRRGDDEASTTRGDGMRLPLEPQRHRTVVHELDVHHRTELTGLDADAGRAKVLHEALVERNRDLR